MLQPHTITVLHEVMAGELRKLREQWPEAMTRGFRDATNPGKTRDLDGAVRDLEKARALTRMLKKLKEQDDA